MNKKILSIALLLSPLAHADQPLPTFQDFLNEVVPSSPLGSPNITILSTSLALGPEIPNSAGNRHLIPVKMAMWEEGTNTKLVFAISSSTEAWNDTSYYSCGTPTEQSIQTHKAPNGADYLSVTCDVMNQIAFDNEVNLFESKMITPQHQVAPYRYLNLSFESLSGKMFLSAQGPISERFKIHERSAVGSGFQIASLGEDDFYSGVSDNLTQEYTSTDFETYPPVETLQPLAPLPAKSTFTFYTAIHLPYGDELAYDIATLKKKYEITATATNINGYVMPLFNFYFAPTSTNLNSVKMVMPYSFPSGDFVVNVTIKDKATGKQFVSTIPGYKSVY